MSKAQTWIAGAIALVLVIIVGGYLVGISPMLTQISQTNSQTTTTQQANTASQAQLANLKLQYAHIGKLNSKLTALRQSVPELAGAPAFLNELLALSSQYGVSVTTLTLANATVYTDPNAAAAATPTTTDATSTDTPAPTTATTPATTTPTTATSGLVLVPVLLTVTGPFENVRQFIGAVQKGTRLFFVSTASIAAGSTGGASAQLAGDIFSLQGVSDGAKTTKLAPLPVSTATPTPTMTPTPTPTNSTTTSSGKTNTQPSTAPTTPPVTPSPTDTPAGP